MAERNVLLMNVKHPFLVVSADGFLSIYNVILKHWMCYGKKWWFYIKLGRNAVRKMLSSYWLKLLRRRIILTSLNRSKTCNLPWQKVIGLNVKHFLDIVKTSFVNKCGKKFTFKSSYLVVWPISSESPVALWCKQLTSVQLDSVERGGGIYQCVGYMLQAGNHIS